MHHSLLQHVVRLLDAPQRFLQLAPVRVFRAMLATKDDAYYRHLVENDAFGPLLWRFQQSLQPPALGSGLFVSASLELLEYIRVENPPIIIEHMCRNHDAIFRENAAKFKTFQGLLSNQPSEYAATPKSHGDIDAEKVECQSVDCEGIDNDNKACLESPVENTNDPGGTAPQQHPEGAEADVCITLKSLLETCDGDEECEGRQGVSEPKEGTNTASSRASEDLSVIVDGGANTTCGEADLNDGEAVEAKGNCLRTPMKFSTEAHDRPVPNVLVEQHLAAVKTERSKGCGELLSHITKRLKTSVSGVA